MDMNAYYYAFFLGLWVEAQITEAQLMTKVPKYISEKQAGLILATEQSPTKPLKTVAEVA